MADNSDHNYNQKDAEMLAKEALSLPMDKAITIYCQLTIKFPTTAKFWKQYAEAWMADTNEDFNSTSTRTISVFNNSLMYCYNIPLWRCYIDFIKTWCEKAQIEGFKEIKNALELTIKYLGYDISSGPVWMEYIDSLKSLPAQTSLEETQRTAVVRKAYQKAIVTPTHHIEQLWKDYEKFENSVGLAQAQGFVSEYHLKFKRALEFYEERKKYIDQIDWNMLAAPPTGSKEEEEQYEAWKKLLAFEKSNPQEVDQQLANERICFTYEQSLMYVCHYPDIWYDYATWKENTGDTKVACGICRRAMDSVPVFHSIPVFSKFAYTEESRRLIQEIKKMYKELNERLQNQRWMMIQTILVAGPRDRRWIR